MKKLSLNLAGSFQSLTKEQMKKINGGYGPTCSISCYHNIGVCANSTDGCTACVQYTTPEISICLGAIGWECSPSSCHPYCPYYHCGCDYQCCSTLYCPWTCPNYPNC